MQINKTFKDNRTIIKISGALNTLNATEFERFIQDLGDKECMNITIDATDLDYISSSGLRVFLKLNKKVYSIGGHTVIKGIKDEIREIFDITGLSATFDMI